MKRVPTGTFVRCRRNRQNLVIGFACFCLEQYKKCLEFSFSGFLPKSYENRQKSKKISVLDDDGNKYNLSDITDCLYVFVDYDANDFWIDIEKKSFGQKSSDVLFRELMYSFKNPEQAGRMQKAETMFLSKRKGYFNAYLMDRLNGKFVPNTKKVVMSRHK